MVCDTSVPFFLQLSAKLLVENSALERTSSVSPVRDKRLNFDITNCPFMLFTGQGDDLITTGLIGLNSR